MDRSSSKPPIPADAYARRYANRAAIREWHATQRANQVVKALEKHGFEAVLLPNKEEAGKKVLEMVGGSATVGCGGSMTIRELGVLAALEQKGATIFDHWKPGLSPEQVQAIRRSQLTCDCFLTSVNAITADGELVSCDATGNRSSAMTFGPKKVIIVAGVNKIVSDLDAALRRVKDVAAPQALRDIGLELPCQTTGACEDCNSPRRGCRIILIMERKPLNTDITVVLVGESLGF